MLFLNILLVFAFLFCFCQNAAAAVGQAPVSFGEVSVSFGDIGAQFRCTVSVRFGFRSSFGQFR